MTVAYSGLNAELVAVVIDTALAFSPAHEPNTSLSPVKFTTNLEQAFDACFEQNYDPLTGLDDRGRAMLGCSTEEFSAGILWQEMPTVAPSAQNRQGKNPNGAFMDDFTERMVRHV